MVVSRGVNPTAAGDISGCWAATAVSTEAVAAAAAAAGEACFPATALLPLV